MRAADAFSGWPRLAPWGARGGLGQDRDPALLGAWVPLRFWPALASLEGLELEPCQPDPERLPSDDDLAAASADGPIIGGQLDLDAGALILRRFEGGGLRAEAQRLLEGGASGLLTATSALLGELAPELDAACGPASAELRAALAGAFEGLSLAEFAGLAELCARLDDTQARLPEGLSGLAAELAELGQGARRPAAAEQALAILILGLARQDYGLAELGWVGLRGGDAAPQLKARVCAALASARLERGSVEGFLKLTALAVELSPDDPVVTSQRAAAAFAQGELEAAEAHWRSLEDDPRFGLRARLGLSRALLQRHRLDEAHEALEAAIPLAATLRAATAREDILGGLLEARCELALRQGDAPAVEATAADHPELFASLGSLARARASALLLGRRPAEAEVALSAWLTREPEDLLARLLRARAQLALGRPEAALEDARAVVEADPEERMFRIALAEALVEAGALEEAQGVFASCADAEGAVPSATYMALVARQREQEGQLAMAEEWYRTAIGSFPDSGFALSEYGAFLIERDRPEEAAELLSTMLESHPKAAGPMKNLQSALLMILKAGATAPGATAPGATAPGATAPGESDERWRALLIRVNERLAALEA